jgi:signal transduction histidine kinase
MLISDDGRGFAADAAPAPGQSRPGIGLVSMRERAASVGGGVDVRSAPGRGTSIRVTLPAWPAPPQGPAPRVWKVSPS